MQFARLLRIDDYGILVPDILACLLPLSSALCILRRLGLQVDRRKTSSFLLPIPPSLGNLQDGAPKDFKRSFHPYEQKRFFFAWGGRGKRLTDRDFRREKSERRKVPM